MEKKKRRSSIKLPNKLNESQNVESLTDETRSRQKKRVSFAAALDVKHFENDWNQKSSENSNETESTRTSLVSEISNFDQLLKGSVLPEICPLSISKEIYDDYPAKIPQISTIPNEFNSNTPTKISSSSSSDLDKNLIETSRPVPDIISIAKDASLTEINVKCTRQKQFLDRMFSYDPPTPNSTKNLNYTTEPMDISQDVRSSVLENSSAFSRLENEKNVSKSSSFHHPVLNNLLEENLTLSSHVNDENVNPMSPKIDKKENSLMQVEAEESYSRIPIYSPRPSRSSISLCMDQSKAEGSKSSILVKKLDSLLPILSNKADGTIGATINDITDLSLVNMDISEMSTLVPPTQYTAMYCNQTKTPEEKTQPEKSDVLMEKSSSMHVVDQTSPQSNSTHNQSLEMKMPIPLVHPAIESNFNDSNSSNMILDSSSFTNSLTFHNFKSILSSTRMTAVIPLSQPTPPRSVNIDDQDLGIDRHETKRMCFDNSIEEKKYHMDIVQNSSISTTIPECEKSSTLIIQSSGRVSKCVNENLGSSIHGESSQTSIARLNSCRNAQSLHNSLLQCSINASLHDTFEKSKSSTEILQTLNRMLFDLRRIKSVAKSEWSRLDSLLTEKCTKMKEIFLLKQSQYVSKLLGISDEIKSLFLERENIEQSHISEFNLKEQLKSSLLQITEKIVDTECKIPSSTHSSSFTDYLYSWVSGWKLLHHFDSSFSYVFLKSLVTLKFSLNNSDPSNILPVSMTIGFSDKSNESEDFLINFHDLKFILNVLQHSKCLLERFSLISSVFELNEYMMIINDSIYRLDHILQQFLKYRQIIGGLSFNHENRSVTFLSISPKSSMKITLMFEISTNGIPTCISYHVESLCDDASLDEVENLKTKLSPVLTSPISSVLHEFNMKTFVNCIQS